VEPAHVEEHVDAGEHIAQGYGAPLETAETAHAEAVVEPVSGLGDSAAAVAAETTEAAGDGHAAASTEIAGTAAAAQALVNEDVVARVLASLSPEVLQSITREILKPVVEAMVREELNKKK
jgi:hypothetical protein